MASDNVREYSYIQFAEKALNVLAHEKTVVRSRSQINADERVRIYRDMAFPETVVVEGSNGMVNEYPWSNVVASRRAASKVVALQQPAEGQARSSNPQHQRR